MKKKSVLITGVAGFIGSNLAKELLRRNYRVVGIDNFSQGLRRNIKELFKDSSFSFMKGDVCNKKTVARACRNVDSIVHLAAFKIPRYGNAMATLKINTKGTENILDAAKNRKLRVVFASTSDIYGKNPQLPFSEESNLLLGQTNIKRWAYAVSKIYDEHLCFAYLEEYGVPITIVRYFGGYGPNHNLTWRGGPQSVFIDCALKQKPIPIHGNGSQKRSFTYISDIVDGTIRALEKKKAIGEAFNVGNSSEISIIEMAGLIWRMVNPKIKPKIQLISYQSFSGKYEDVKRRKPDLKKSKALLNFKPSTNLKKGLRLTIDWQRKLKV